MCLDDPIRNPFTTGRSAQQRRLMAVASTLVLGGQRSGKSRYAEELVLESGLEPVYVATAEAWDDEMADRIARHRERRGDAWQTINEPLAVAETISGLAKPDCYLLVDCLTLWLSNLMHAGRDIQESTADLIQSAQAAAGPVVFVSNEVGSGVIPDNALARRFADAQGALNQAVARAADRVILMAAGIPLQFKPSMTIGTPS